MHIPIALVKLSSFIRLVAFLLNACFFGRNASVEKKTPSTGRIWIRFVWQMLSGCANNLRVSLSIFLSLSLALYHIPSDFHCLLSSASNAPFTFTFSPLKKFIGKTARETWMQYTSEWSAWLLFKRYDHSQTFIHKVLMIQNHYKEKRSPFWKSFYLRAEAYMVSN